MAEIMCPRCGSQTVIITSKEDNRRYYVCVNRPECKGRIAADEAAGYVWGEERPVSIGAGGTWQQTETSSSSGAGPGPLRRLGEGVLGLRYIFKPSNRKGKARRRHKKGEPHKPKQLPSKPRSREVQTMPGAYEVKETPSPGSPTAPKSVESQAPQRVKPASAGRKAGWGDDWAEEAPARKAAANKPRSIKVPQAAPPETEQIKIRKVTIRKSEQPDVPQKEAASERKEPPGPRTEPSPEEEIVPEKVAEDLDEKKPVRRWWQRIIGEEPPPEEKEPPKIRRKEISVREVPLKKKEEPPGPDVPQVPIERAPGKREEPAVPIAGGEVPYVPGGPLMAPQMASHSGMVPDVNDASGTRPRQREAPGKAVYTGGGKPSRPRPQSVRRKEATPERKARPRPARQGTKAPVAASKTKRPARPVKPTAPKARKPDKEEKFIEPEPQEAARSELDTQKKQLLIMMVVIFIVFNLAIDGMLYALFMLQ